jgi:WD40 repeat protein
MVVFWRRLRLTKVRQDKCQSLFCVSSDYFRFPFFSWLDIKLWTSSGKFLATFRGHVGEVYQLCWSADSRMIVSGSKDSTMKVWDVRTRKLKEDLPGHADEVYSVDWSPDGERVGSGSKDRLLKMYAPPHRMLLRWSRFSFSHLFFRSWRAS